jgi:hypothetical protein
VAKVQRTQESYDADLAEQGLRRVLYPETNEDGLIAYRERTIKIKDYTEDKTPWWKNTQKKKPSKPSKA